MECDASIHDAMDTREAGVVHPQQIPTPAWLPMPVLSQDPSDSIRVGIDSIRSTTATERILRPTRQKHASIPTSIHPIQSPHHRTQLPTKNGAETRNLADEDDAR